MTNICPKCGTQYDAGISFCSKDGSRLIAHTESGSDLVGTVVADRYRIDGKLGEGGMGQVYLAEHVTMKRKSAIKILRPALVGDVEALQRFTREAEHASQISHPNVAAIYDFGETSDHMVYLAMEYVDGESLSSKLAREMAIHPEITADIIGQAADALQTAHDMGILHRDLKPDNIMLGRRADGTYIVKLVDFGIARTMHGGEKVTQTGMAVGTPEFMSPEQLAGDTLDGRSDQYSLALVAFAALTGKDAFPAETSKESLVARLTSRPQKLQDARAEVRWPHSLQLIFDRALAPDPNERYPSVLEFANALTAAISAMTPSQTAGMYRRALEARLASVAIRTPHADLSTIRASTADAASTEEGTVPDGAEVAAADRAESEVPAAAAATTGTVEVSGVPSRPRFAMGWATKTTLILSGAFVVGLAMFLMFFTPPDDAPSSTPADSAATQVAAADSTALAQQVEVVADSTALATPVVPATQEQAPRPRVAEPPPPPRDTISAAERARLDSLARRAAAIERFPEDAFVAGERVVPDWRERTARGSDLRVVVMTPPVNAWRARAAQTWKSTNTLDSTRRYVDHIEAWTAWDRIVRARRPVVVLEVLAERAPFLQFSDNRVQEFRRGDVERVVLMRDGISVPLLNIERIPAVVNPIAYGEANRPVPHAVLAVIPPETFAPHPDGKWPKFEVRVVDVFNDSREARIELNERVVRRIHEDFAPYRSALQ